MARDHQNHIKSLLYFDIDLQRGREGIETLEGKISAVTLIEEI